MHHRSVPPVVGALVIGVAVLAHPSTVNVSGRLFEGGSTASELIVSPDGHADAAGTLAAPLSLAAALSDETPARPGSTVWLRGGVYRGAFVSSASGQPGAPIRFRPYRGERAVIDSAPSTRAALTVLGNWTWFEGFEITNSSPLRKSKTTGPWPEDLNRGGGVDAKGSNNAFINLVVHDLTGGFGVWAESQGSIVYGNLVYYNGWQGPDRAHGHGIYTQNRSGTRLIADNIVFGQFSHGIHAFGSENAYLDDITLRGNIVFNNGALADSGAERDILLGGGRMAARPILEANATFGPAQSALGWDGGCLDGRVTGNVLVGTTPLVLVRCQPAMSDNIFVGNTGDLSKVFAGAAGDLSIDYPGNTFHKKTPSEGVHTLFRVNQYNPHRAHVAVYNWGRQAVVELDVTGFLYEGDRFEVIDAQNFFGAPVVSGTYAADRPLRIPMTAMTMTTPVGDVPRTPRHTAPEFGAFIVRVVEPAPRAGTPAQVH